MSIINKNFTIISICSVLTIFLFHTIQYYKNVKKPLVIYGSKKSQDLVKKCKTLNTYYYPFYFAFGKNSQLILSLIYNYYQRQMNIIKWTAETFVMRDGQEITVDWAFNPHINSESGLIKSVKDTPILIIQHGGMCYSKNLPGQGWVHEAHKKGWIVCCQHRRGTHKNLTIPKINIFGSTDDIKFFIENYLLKRRPNAKILMIGISAGSGLVGRFLGENNNSSLITAAMGLCPGYDISVCMNRSDFFYKNHLINSIKNFYLKKNIHHFHSFDGFNECLNAIDAQEYLDNAYAMAGYKSKDDYYKNCNPILVMSNITTPFMLINSKDDPVCVYQNALENLHLFLNSPSMIFVGTKTGTHCAFWEKFSTKSWAEKVTFEYFDLCLQEFTPFN